MNDDDRRSHRRGIRPAGGEVPGPAPPEPPTLRHFPQLAPPPPTGPLRVVSAPPPSPGPEATRPPAVAPAAKPPPARSQLLVTLADSAPLVWRRLSVPNTITLAKLHRVLQAAIGWADSHLHRFVAGDTV